MILKQKKAGKKTKNRRLSERDRWKDSFTEKIRPIHKQFTTKAVNRIMRRCTATKRLMDERSKKHNVPSPITIEELTDLTYTNYGKPCRFCGKPLVITTLVYDHIIPIARGGPSSKDNIQIICKICNRRKGALDQDCFIKLLKWLDTMPDEFRRDILAKLSGWRR